MKMRLKIFCVIFVLPIILCDKVNSDVLPVVFWHGMGDACCIPASLGKLANFLKSKIPGLYVHSLKIGDSFIEEVENSYFMNPNKQVEVACEMLKADTNLAKGFNIMGFSQGGQFVRALVQRCGHQLPPIVNMVTFGAQHQGVYGLPHCGVLEHKTCDYVRKLLSYAAYDSWVQETLVQATYWHDPLREITYRNYSQFLSDINNEQTVNKTYVKNMKNLKNFVMVKFTKDSMVLPIETEWFGYYLPGQSNATVPLTKTRIYLKDRLGLQKMDQLGKLKFLAVDGDHLQFTTEWFMQNIVNPYILNYV